MKQINTSKNKFWFHIWVSFIKYPYNKQIDQYKVLHPWSNSTNLKIITPYKSLSIIMHYSSVQQLVLINTFQYIYNIYIPDMKNIDLEKQLVWRHYWHKSYKEKKIFEGK